MLHYYNAFFSRRNTEEDREKIKKNIPTIENEALLSEQDAIENAGDYDLIYAYTLCVDTEKNTAEYLDLEKEVMDYIERTYERY